MTRTAVPLAILLAAFLLPVVAHAGAATFPATAPVLRSVEPPKADRAPLLKTLGAWRSRLIARRAELVRTVADSKPGSGDALISVIHPGGILHAGYKKARYAQARQALARVDADIRELSGDLLAMEPLSTTVAVAPRPE